MSNPTLWNFCKLNPLLLFRVVYVLLSVFFLYFCMVLDFEEKEKEPAKQRQGKDLVFQYVWHFGGEDVSEKQQNRNKQNTSPKIFFVS